MSSLAESRLSIPAGFGFESREPRCTWSSCSKAVPRPTPSSFEFARTRTCATPRWSTATVGRCADSVRLEVAANEGSQRDLELRGKRNGKGEIVRRPSRVDLKHVVDVVQVDRVDVGMRPL